MCVYESSTKLLHRENIMHDQVMVIHLKFELIYLEEMLKTSIFSFSTVFKVFESLTDDDNKRYDTFSKAL